MMDLGWRVDVMIEMRCAVSKIEQGVFGWDGHKMLA